MAIASQMFSAGNANGASYLKIKASSIFPHIRPAVINVFQGLQVRVLLERGYYLRASIILSVCTV